MADRAGMTTPLTRFLVGAAMLSMALPAALPAAAAPAGPEAPGRVLVRFVDDGPAPRSLAGVSALQEPRVGRNTGITVADVPSGTSPAVVAAQLRARSDVVWAEPDQRWHPAALSELLDDPGADQLWGLHSTGQTVSGVAGTKDVDVDAPEAWQITRGRASVVVAVIDTGVDIEHPDLAANVWTNPGEVPGNGIDDDANGYVDDVHGWDFANDDASVFDDASDDMHGTHVAGTIAARADNGRGIAGVAPGVTVMPLKFIGSNGSGSTSAAVEAIEYAAAMGADVVNASWGGSSKSGFLSEAIDELDAVFVAAAGNAGRDADSKPVYPAAYPHDNIVSVAALTHTGSLASFSNWGATSVDVGAPGRSVLSTVPGGRYWYLSGTSMAAPHVAGAAGLVHSAAAGLSPQEVIGLLLDTTTPLASLQGRTVTGGIVRARAAVWQAAAVTPPGKVRDLAATFGAGSVGLSWRPPADTGGVPVADYVVTASPGNHRAVTSSTNASLTQLRSGTTYTLTVTARSNAGTGPGVSTTATPAATKDTEDTTGDPDAAILDPARIAGSDRFATGAAISRSAFGAGVTDVYVATGHGFPDALAGTAAAASRGGPVLLVASGHVPEAVATELDRLRPQRIWVLGGRAAVSDDVLEQLAATGAQVRRLAGPDRYATSAVVSSHAFAPGLPVAYVATGTGFPDALGAGAAAGVLGGPVLLTARDSLPSSVAAELQRLRPARVVVLGGTAAVADSVVSAVQDATGAKVDRIGGSSRYETSSRVVADAFPSGTSQVLLATGEGFPDALAGGAAAARTGSPVLLVAPDGTLPTATVEELRRLRPRSIVALGGTGALSDAVVQAVADVLR